MDFDEARRIGDEVMKYLHEHHPDFQLQGAVVYPTEIVIAVLKDTPIPSLPKEIAGLPVRVEVRPQARWAIG